MRSIVIRIENKKEELLLRFNGVAEGADLLNPGLDDVAGIDEVVRLRLPL